jgi:hypothetical protein
MYHLHDNPHILKRLREELKRSMPDPKGPIDMVTLVDLPWLVSLREEQGKRIALLVLSGVSFRRWEKILTLNSRLL